MFDKFFIIICAIFFFKCINLLFEESYNVVYNTKFKDKNLIETHKFSTCFPFDQILNHSYANRSDILIEELFPELIKGLLNYYDKLEMETGLSIEEELKNGTLKSIKSKNYYIHNYHFCFIFNNGKLFSYFKINLDKFGTLKHFFFLHKPYLFFDNEITDDKSLFLTINEPNLPDAKCNRLEKNSPQPWFILVNDCLKNHHRSAKYFYASKEKGIIDLKKKNLSISETEDSCFNNDKFINDCENSFFITKSTGEKNVPFMDNPVVETKYSWKKIEATFKMSKLDFYFSIIGLFCLFTKTSFLEIVPEFCKVLSYKFFQNNQEKFEKLIKWLKYFTFFLCLIGTIVVCFKMEIDFENTEKNPKLFERSEFNPQTNDFILILCISTDAIFREQNPFEKNDNLFEENEEENFENISFKKLIDKTDVVLLDEIKSIYLDFADKRVDIKWSLSNKTLFAKKHRFKVFRCFQLKIYIKNIEDRYQSLSQISRLVIKLNKLNFIRDFAILSEKSDLNSNFYEFRDVCNIKMVRNDLIQYQPYVL